MRLLEVDVHGEIISIKNFLADCIPPYAILSHTWGDDDAEVSFDDLGNLACKRKVGYAKLDFCARQARQDNLRYCWVDTCCINKASHTELSEAITSMFSWYRNAVKCYVYLADVSTSEPGAAMDAHQIWQPAFLSSRWFTRGWTLQELIAPDLVEFYSQEGELLGNKSTLEAQIHQITQIPVSALRGSPMSTFSVDERMQWATHRNTTRKEDRAYCLLGIFNVFMPLMYGEAENAYVRLRRKLDKQLGATEGNDNFISNTASFSRIAEQRSSEHPGTATMESGALACTSRDKILRSLWYPRMRERIDQVAEAHRSTYKWILESSTRTGVRSDNLHTSMHSSPEDDRGEFNHYLNSSRSGRTWSSLDDKDSSNPYKFLPWLRAQSPEYGIFWVSGKIGSGKSTLMRYIDAHVDKNEHMEPWASGLTVMRAQHFFWNPAESILQKSFVGLLRSLLFQLLQHNPEHIQFLVPLEKWNDAQRMESTLEWNKAELLKLVKTYFNYTCKLFRIFLVIDGLDEIEGSSQDVDDLLNFLNSIAEYSHVKACVSSRPMIAFQDTFNGGQTLKLEELTRADINSFVVETLTAHRRFNYLQRIDPNGTQELTRRVTKKAQGVFLWAKLVVRELLRKVRNGEGIVELLKTLDEFPQDLDDHFRRLIDAVPSLYRREAYIMFQIAVHHEEYFEALSPLRLLDLSFIDAAGTNFALDQQPELGDKGFFDREAVLFLLDSTLRKLNSRCVGILECHYNPGATARLLGVSNECLEPPFTNQIMHDEDPNNALFLPMIQEIVHQRQHKLFRFDFLIDFPHRSLKDFMLKDGLRLLQRDNSDNFDPRNFLRNARLLQVQQASAAKLCIHLTTATCSYILSTLAIPGYRASKISSYFARHLFDVIKLIPGSVDYVPDMWYIDASLNVWQVEGGNPLTLAIDFGLETYIEENLHRRAILDKSKRPILDYILRPRFAGSPIKRLRIGYQTPSAHLAQLVLGRGGDPNERWSGSTVWALFLCFIATVVKRYAQSEKSRHDYLATLMVMIRRGAARTIPRTYLSAQGYLELYQDSTYMKEAKAGDRFRKRWAAVERFVTQDAEGEWSYDVHDLVMCFDHPNLFTPEQVNQLQILINSTQGRESSPDTT